MDRELLIELGCEELPASWLPSLTAQLGEHLSARLTEVRLAPEAPVETFSTPRRLTVRVAKVPERQTDLEDLVTGPAVSSAFGPEGQPTQAAMGFARKHGVEVSGLERMTTAKGTYLAFRKRQRGKAAVDVLPGVLGALLRSLTFPKHMHWDAALDDGRGELLFGRPIRWILFLYGPRVVPFTISRLPVAHGRQIQDVRSGAATYGHRFLATTGRAGRAVKVRSFEEYRTRLLENFVVLDRSERHDKIARELDAHASRLGGRVSRDGAGQSRLLEEVPDLVEYPSVIAGTFAPEFLALPEEVLTTTMIHHQHYFPLVNGTGRLLPAFLAVTNTQPDNERVIAHNAERVLTARLRDAQFFWEADRKMPLASRVADLETVLFHKVLGSYKAKSERIERLAQWIASEAFRQPAEVASQAAQAARLAKADLTTDMVKELTELQGMMGGIYAREEGMPEEIWKAIYYQYLPVSVEADAPPTGADLGKAAVTWAAVSLADKLDTVVGLFAAGEKPTGSRDPYGLRRAAHGVFRVLVDLKELTGIEARPTLQSLLDAAVAPFAPFAQWDAERFARFVVFVRERLSYVLEQRGFDVRNVRAVAHRTLDHVRPADELRKLRVLPEFTETPDFQQLATAFKRVKNIAINLPMATFDFQEQTGPPLEQVLVEPAELALHDELKKRQPVIEEALARGEDFHAAFAEAARFGPVVAKFFDDVMVMTDNERLRTARLRLLRRLESLMLKLADISEIVPEETKQA